MPHAGLHCRRRSDSQWYGFAPQSYRVKVRAARARTIKAYIAGFDIDHRLPVAGQGSKG